MAALSTKPIETGERGRTSFHVERKNKAVNIELYIIMFLRIERIKHYF